MKEDKPTREERLKAYQFAREWLNKNMDNQVGVCRLLQMAADPNDYSICDFPEFLEMKPKDKEESSYWFSSAKERIQVLTKIINKMKEEECPFMKQPEKAVFYIPTYFDIKNPEEIADREDKEALILEELKALREEVEKLKRGKPRFMRGGVFVDQGEAIINRREAKDLITETIDFFKGLKEEKPKESPEQKGMLQINLGKCAFEILSSRERIDVTVKEDKNYASISLEKTEAIKIVNYLKKHFDIED